ncbi:bifunctional glycosyltransferase/CDP-glycerol:glycerophosphate glycerophosphotransferase [Arthrobacter monumenti]
MKNRNTDILRASWRLLPPTLKGRLKPVVRRILATDTKAPSQTAPPPAPILSVVVPVYNVEQYLDECLSSLVAQPITRMEIIIVDDGSTDGSLAIAERYAASDSRFTIVRQPNAGLGAARNTGIAHSYGRYLTFADSDDVVPAGAYQLMVDTLKRSGSDFAVGSVRRLAGDRRKPFGSAGGVHSRQRIGISITDFPEALRDVFAWNKMFRRSFWDAQVGGFPEGLRYEDQEPSAKAFLRAESFDILTDVVYEWRIRLDRSSITQQKTSMGNLEDRLAVVDRTSTLVQAEADEEVWRDWFARILGHDLGQYYRQIPRVSDGYWTVLQIGVRKLLARADDAVWQRMRVHERLLVHLVAAGHRSDLETVLLHLAQYGSAFPLVNRGGVLSAEPSFLTSLQHPIEERLLLIDPRYLQLRSRLTAVRAGAEGKLDVEGAAYVPGLDLASNPSELTLWLKADDGRAPIKLPVSRFRDDAIDQSSNDAWTSHVGAAFKTTIDPRSLENANAAPGSTDAAEWQLEMTLRVADVAVSGPFSGRDRSGPAATLPLVAAGEASRCVARFDDGKGLILQVVPVTWKVPAVRLNGRNLELDIATPDGETAESLVLQARGRKISLTAAPRNSTTGKAEFLVALPELTAPAPGESPSKPQVWQIRGRSSSGALHRLTWPGSSAELRHQYPEGLPLRPSVDGLGQLELRESALAIFAETVTLDSEKATLAIKGRVTAGSTTGFRPGVQKMILASAERNMEASRFTIDDDGIFDVEFPLAQKIWGRIVAAPQPGNYSLLYLTKEDGDEPFQGTVPVTAGLESSLPLEFDTNSTTIRVTRSAVAANLYISFAAPLKADESGKFQQTGLITSLHSTVHRPGIEESILFESYGGRAVSDSGLELHRELVRLGDTRTKYWSVKDRSIPVPAGAVPVIRHSRRWYELLGSAGLLVNNGLFPHYFRKNSRQKYIQTWHGTPLKRTGHDGPTAHLELPELAALKREAEDWDILLAQNDFAADVLPKALGYNGESLVTGYPRNDTLSGAEDGRRRQVRELLGIADHKKAILYAPTWRDDVSDIGKPHGQVDFMDCGVLQSALGNDYVVLHRSHPDMTGPRNSSLDIGVDVTSYPDINELYLAADILVTDYSSAMFDFCNTAKPIYFLVPDLDSVREGSRGLYLDLETIAPGPLVNSTNELAAAIEMRADPASHRTAAYDAFIRRFLPYDDGHAARRVIEAVF